MNQIERLHYLVEELEKESGYDYPIPFKKDDLFYLYRGLVNMRPAGEASTAYLKIQDEMLKEETKEKGIVSFNDDKQLEIWQGDITRLKVGVIVDAANDQMEGCFIPNHTCIDNAIHTYAGLQLRNECHDLMMKQGILEPTGKAKITHAYNLPCDYVIHTVGPIVRGPLTKRHKALLSSCYSSCLNLADKYHLESMAFPCISTGVFMFPSDKACAIAVKTVQEWLRKHSDTSIKKVIFNVFKDSDRELYERMLAEKQNA